MGSRRTHEEAAVAAARAAYLAGFASTSNLAAGRAATASRPPAPRRTRSPCCTTTSAPRSRAGRRARHRHDAARRHLRHHRADRHRRDAAGPALGAIRIDSGDLGVLARQAREQLDALGATAPRSSSAAISTSSRSPDWPRRRSTSTAPAPRWSPARARRPPGWSTSSSRSTAGRWPSGRSTRPPTAGARRAFARPQADRHRDRGDRVRAPGSPPPGRANGRSSARWHEPDSRSTTCRPSPIARPPARGHRHAAVGRTEALPGRAGDPDPHRAPIIGVDFSAR